MKVQVIDSSVTEREESKGSMKEKRNDARNIEEQKCPSCSGPLEHGYIVGHWFRLRWTRKEKTYTIFAGKPLKKKADWWHAPTVEAARCDRCKIGIFIYD